MCAQKDHAAISVLRKKIKNPTRASSLTMVRMALSDTPCPIQLLGEKHSH